MRTNRKYKNSQPVNKNDKQSAIEISEENIIKQKFSNLKYIYKFLNTILIFVMMIFNVKALDIRC